jgi:hypothetical protein
MRTNNVWTKSKPLQRDRRAHNRAPDPPCPVCRASGNHVQVTTRTVHYFLPLPEMRPCLAGGQAVNDWMISSDRSKRPAPLSVGSRANSSASREGWRHPDARMTVRRSITRVAISWSLNAFRFTRGSPVSGNRVGVNPDQAPWGWRATLPCLTEMGPAMFLIFGQARTLLGELSRRVMRTHQQ